MHKPIDIENLDSYPVGQWCLHHGGRHFPCSDAILNVEASVDGLKGTNIYMTIKTIEQRTGRNLLNHSF